MKRKVEKFLVALCILNIFVLNISYAAGIAENFKGSTEAEIGDASGKIKEILNIALTVVRDVGVGCSLIILSVIAIKYIMASAGEKADIKKRAIPFVIGALILFGASTIITLIKNISLGLFN